MPQSVGKEFNEADKRTAGLPLARRSGRREAKIDRRAKMSDMSASNTATGSRAIRASTANRASTG